MTMINIKLPDSTVKTVKSGTTVYQIASDIGPGLLKASIAAKIDNVLVDLNTPINSDCSLEIITCKSEEAHDILLHSTAHLMAQAVKEIFPHSSIAIGPALKETFYIDLCKSYFWIYRVRISALLSRHACYNYTPTLSKINNYTYHPDP